MLKLKTNTAADPVAVLIWDAVSEFYRAVDKHPLWPESLVDDTKFLEAAVIKRDRAAARHELAQCMAMLIRIGTHLDDYLPNDEQEIPSPEFEPCDVCERNER